MVRCARHTRLGRERLLTVLAFLAIGCASTTPTEVTGIADQTPLPYSVLVTGGSFVETSVGSVSDDAPLAHTFAVEPDSEPLPLAAIVRALQEGRVFSRIAEDHVAAGTRARLARARAGLPLGDSDVGALLDRARREGHDFVVVVHRLVDAPIDEYGINDRWPLTVSLWVLVGLGMFIPDHTFESRATLQAGVFEVHTGRLVHRTVGAAGPADLSLVARGDLWSLVQSILIPPFWVGNDEETVADELRRVTGQRLVAALARQLKSASCRQDLEERSIATIEAIAAEGGYTLRIRTEGGLGSIALRIDGRPVDDAEVERLLGELRASAMDDAGGGLRLEGRLPALPGGRYLQVLIRTLAGEVASITIDLEEG